MSNFDDHVMATDKARADKNARLANPQPGFYNKVREALRNAAIKCHMMCKQDNKPVSSNGKEGDCSFTEDV
jgi:hypothetical protein